MTYLYWLLFCFLYTNTVKALPTRLDNYQVNKNVAQLYVGINSLAAVRNNTIYERHLEISWSGIDSYLNDTVVIFSYDNSSYCSLQNALVVEEMPIHNFNESWIRLNTSMPYLTEEELTYQSQCVLYWAAYIRYGEILACNCLRSHPSWMWERREMLKGFPLRNLFLPGTHDAAAYEKYLGLISNNLATKYAVAQGENLLVQLLYGVRYLDMRVLFRPNTEERLWTHHGSYIFRPLVNETILIKQFLMNSNDIVIMDLHGIDGFDQEPNAHEELQAFLYEEFREWMAPSNLTWNATLDDFWSINKRLIVTYNDDHGIGVPFLWEAVRHQWGNVNELANLETYLQSVMDEAAQGKLQFAWSAMAELTPTSLDVAGDRLNGLRGAADIVNRDMTIWFRDRWAPYATIVAADFFLGSNIVQVAIAENERRASQVIYPFYFHFK